MSSQPFGVDLSNVEFKNPSEESNVPSHEGAPSGGEAPSGEAFKSEKETKGEGDAGSPKEKVEQRVFSKDELESILGIKTEPQKVDTKKFDDNFGFDIATLLKDPKQFGRFAQIYPQAYVERAKQILAANGINPNAQPTMTTKPDSLDPRIQRALEIADRFEAMQKEQRIEAIGQKLDTAFEKLSQKYPDADKNVVNWYLQGLAQQKVNLMDEKGNLRMQILEKLFKSDHDARNAAYEKKYRSKVENQKKVNLKAQDMGSGGSLSSVQGKQARTIKEATNAILADLRASQ